MIICIAHNAFITKGMGLVVGHTNTAGARSARDGWREYETKISV